ncbi:hypothetical protein [Bradyrhizobium cosmicum]|nr:hypothetical protein [Bradyrhizobium cosmicum]
MTGYLIIMLKRASGQAQLSAAPSLLEAADGEIVANSKRRARSA